MCVISEVGVVRSGRRGSLWLSGAGKHVWVAVSRPLTLDGISVSQSCFESVRGGLHDDYMSVTKNNLEMRH